MEKTVFTTFEAAKLCHVSPLSIINWVNAGRLPAFRTPGGHRRIRRDDLVRFMRDAQIPLPDELTDGSGRPKVLVVDDEPAIRGLLADSLANRPERPFEVSVAADGFEAGRLVSSFRPDVVLLDLRMPGLDGFQVCRTIKDDKDTRSIVVVAMTGYHTPETEARAIECGASRCVAKPFTPAEIASVLDGLLAAAGSRATTGRRRRSGRA